METQKDKPRLFRRPRQSLTGNKQRFLLTAFVLAVAAVSPVAPAASIRCQSDAQALVNTGFASGGIDYQSGAGLTLTPDPSGHVALNFGPSDALNQYYFLTGAVIGEGTNPITQLPFSADVQTIVNTRDGSIRCYATGVQGGGRSYGEINDTISFQNSTSDVVEIEVRFVVEGSFQAFSIPGGGSGSATVESSLHFTNMGPNPDPTYYGGTFHFASGTTGYYDLSELAWGSYSLTPEKANGATCVGHLHLLPGESVFAVSFILIASAEDGISSYQNTAALQLSLPPGVSFHSESGALLADGARLLNISTRADVLSSDSVAIGGFIVTGNEPKNVIIRGIGPSLSAAGVSGALADTTLELYQDTTLIATNDNWRDSQENEIQATGIAPTNDLEAAIVGTLDPGSYTAILRGKNNTTGVGLVEVYDLQPTVDSRLANISTRAFVEAGDNVLIGGIIGGGNGSQPRVLIRAIGPSLTGAGIANALQNPFLELHDSNGTLIASNDNWQSDQQVEIEATGLAPTNAQESAILTTLLPTTYTAIVRGVNDTSGIGLVEVYQIP